METNRLILLSDIKDTAGLPEQIVRALMETSDVGIAVIQGMAIKFTNQQFLDRLGYTRDELEKKYVLELIHSDDIDYLAKQYVGVSSGAISASEPVEFRCVAKDGTVIHTEAKVTLIEWAGATAGLCLFWDVEKRKAVEEYLRREVKKRSDVLNGIPDRLIHIDAELRIVLVNRATSESTGISPDDMLGRYCYDVFQQSDGPCENCPARETIETGRAAEGRVTYPGDRVLLITSSPVIDDRGTTTGLIIKGVDITRIDTGEHEYRAGPPSASVLSAPADPNYLYPFSLRIDSHKGRIMATLGWKDHGPDTVLERLSHSELHSARLLYLAARMKSDGKGWVDKEVIRPGKMDYNLYDFRKFLEQCRIPWLDGWSARMLIRSGGEANRMIRLALPGEKITISREVGDFRSNRYKRLEETEKRIAALEKDMARWPDDEYLSHELVIQKKNFEDTRKSIDTVEFLISESVLLLSESEKNLS